MNSTAQSEDNLNKGEKFIYRERDIQISNLRFVTGDETYAMSGITSVKYEALATEYYAPIVMFLIAIIICISTGKFTNVYSLLCLAAAIGILATRPRKYSVTLGTSGGEVQSYISKDRKLVMKIVKALNDAIIMRG